MNNQEKKNRYPYRMVVKVPYSTNDVIKNAYNEIGKLTVFSKDVLPEDVSFLIEVNHMPGVKVNAYPIEPKK